MKRNAIISVYDKSEIKKICEVLNRFNIGIISTGATAKKIISLGYKCSEISSLTKFKEILDGRVKTLNPKLHASILYKRNNPEHQEAFNKLNFPFIDFIIVNFYPFTKISNKEMVIEKSIFVRNDIANETTQIVLSGITSSLNTKIEWSLEKI